MAKWSLETITLPLKRPWKISRGEVTEKENVIITYDEGKMVGKGEVAFITNAQVSREDVVRAFEDFNHQMRQPLNGLEDIMGRLNEMELPANLRFGIESSYIHFLAQLMEDKVPRVLGVREVNNVATSFSIPHMSPNAVESYLLENNVHQFSSVKIKIIGAEDVAFVKEVHRLFSGSLRLDANEGFKSAQDVLIFLEAIKEIPIEFLEQPLSHNDFDECCRLREKSPVLLMADESLQDGNVVDEFQKAFHGVNIKLQKSGGYIKALKQMKDARALGLKTMLGCMIETSLGISSALNIAHGVDFYDLDGFLHLQNDPFDAAYVDKGKVLFSFHQ